MVERHLVIYEPEPYLGEFSRAGADLSTGLPVPSGSTVFGSALPGIP
jgi:hypothetical protein